MTLEKLNELIASGEGERLEYKETTGQRVEACRTLCAFLNGDGGTVVFGVSRKGKLTGQLVSDETKKDLARAFCDFEPGIEIPTEYVDVDESHQAIVCRVEGGAQKPYAYDGRPYRRVQSSTVKMPQEQYATLISRRNGFQSKWELQHEEGVSLDDVDLNEVTRTAKIAVAEGRLSPDVDVNDPKDLLRRFGLLKGDQPLNGALAHRLYTSSGSVSLAIYEDRVEISNPGNFNPEIAVQGAFPGMASTPRNPTIAKVLYLRKAIEMWGRGIGLIVNACEKARIAAPKIYEDHGFIYTVFTRPTVQEWKDKIGGGTTQTTTQTTAQTTQTTTQTGIHRSFELTDAQTRIVEYLREHPSASRREIVENSGVAISEDGVKYNLARLQDLHRIKRVGPDYGGHWEVCD